MTVWERIRRSWKQGTAGNDDPKRIFFRPWWHPGNLVVVLMPGFWGVIIGVIISIVLAILFVFFWIEIARAGQASHHSAAEAIAKDDFLDGQQTK